MTKTETEAYYAAIGRKRNLLIIDSTDSDQKIKRLIQEKLDRGVDSIAVEAFYNNATVLSCEITAAPSHVMDLYQDRQCKLFNETLDKIAGYIAAIMPKAVQSPYDMYIAERLPDNTFLAKSFTSDKTRIIDPLDPARRTADNEFILGEYRYPDGQLEYHPLQTENREALACLSPIIDRIQNEDIKVFANTCLRIIPDYVLTAPACDSSENRPASNAAAGGLLRHLHDTAAMLLHLTEQDYAHIEYTAHEIDMMLVACLFHDFLHRGWQEDYETDGSILFAHPRMAANALMCIRGIIPLNDLMFITNAIASHMGQNNTNPDEPTARQLPIPDTRCKYLVHLANHLVTRKHIMMVHDNTIFAYEHQTVKTTPCRRAVSEDEAFCIQNAMSYDIDLALAKEIGVYEVPIVIQTAWKRIMNTRTILDGDEPYILLARKMTSV